MDDQQPTYNLSLLLAFIANVFQLISVSLLFRYADFVASVGGDEWHLGWIVGTSALGAILLRIFQGAAIDRFGAELIWYACLVGQIIGLLWHLQIESASSFQVYLARTLYASSLAGTFGSWLSFVSLQAPKGRVAEVIGVVGASGFVGMATGPVIGDYIFQMDGPFSDQVHSMFCIAAISSCLSLAFAIGACRTAKTRPVTNSDSVENDQPLPKTTTAPKKNPLTTIANAKPGFVLVLGVLMGMTIGFPGTYLRPLAASLEIHQINVFFLVYNITAFVSRLLFRRAPQILGLKINILLGYALMITSMLLYLGVKTEMGLFWPAFAGGLAHSFLFPSVITACTEYFSSSDRGVATNLILAMYDMGTLVGMPLIGAILTQSRSMNLPPYNTSVLSIAAIIFVVLAIYASVGHGKTNSQQQS